MSYVIEIMPEAEDAIFDRYIYIRQKGSPQAAENFYSGVYLYMSLYLTNNPKLFRTRDDIGEGLRVAFYKNNTAIVYSVDDVNKIVTVSNVYHTSQDFQ